jgi:hypothetical protein
MPYKVLAKYLDQISFKLFRSSRNKVFLYSVRTGRYIWTANEYGVCR